MSSFAIKFSKYCCYAGIGALGVSFFILPGIQEQNAKEFANVS